MSPAAVGNLRPKGQNRDRHERQSSLVQNKQRRRLELIYDDLGSVNRFSRPRIKIAGSFSGLNTIANGPELLSNVLHCRPEISNSNYIAMGSNATVSIETNLSQSNKGEEWILDSGATDHMTFSRQDISQITQPRKSSVFNANGIPYPVSGAEVGSPEYVTVQSENNPTGPRSTSSSHITDIVQSFSPGQLDTPQPSPDTNDHEVSIPEPSPEPEYTIESVPPNPTGYVLPQRINRGIPPKRFCPDCAGCESQYPIAHHTTTESLTKPLQTFTNVLCSNPVPRNNRKVNI
ncbi:hypothetical protein ACH5RR_021294 [Cinchona calisaya]|uniref:Uncharacterized protein n=1 Tax=Cinchona calisaya TaxID=153742 RepID=A0ABD2ZGW3_9GENT